MNAYFVSSQRSSGSSASLFAFGVARQAAVACVALVSNAVDHAGEQYNTGSMLDGLEVLKGIARASRSLAALLGEPELRRARREKRD